MAGLCGAVGVSRAGYYRQAKHGRQARVGAVELHAAVQAIALEMPGYGYRRVSAELKQRGWAVNHQRVLRVMRQDNLLCLHGRRFVRTTNSDHWLPVYRNLAAEMVLTGIDQRWVADITYIRLESEFVYVAVILDAYSRRVIGCPVGQTLRTELVMCSGASAKHASGAGWMGASFRSRDSVCLASLHGALAPASDRDQHEPARQPLR